jgi:hypothetical protein
MAQIKEEMTSDKIDVTYLLVRSLRLCALCGSTVVLVTTVYLRIAKKARHRLSYRIFIYKGQCRAFSYS